MNIRMSKTMIYVIIISVFILKDIGCVWYADTVEEYSACISKTYASVPLAGAN